MAEFKTAAIFSDAMVLQREKNICVFGEGVTGAEVVVTLNQKTVKTIVKDEKWSVLLPPMSAQTGLEMQVTSGATNIRFVDIAIGEVWLAGGQSNMEFELQNAIGGKEMLLEDMDCNVRYFYSNKMAYIDESFYENEKKTHWQTFDKESAKNWSAVAYIYAKRLAKELGVVVGIIGCNWGGTSASCWMEEESLCEDIQLKEYWDEYNDVTKNMSVEEQIKVFKEYEAFHANWEKECTKLYEQNPDISWDEIQTIIGTCQYPGPKSCMNPFRPSGLYHTIVKRLIPYTLRGFIYYQGESDDHKPEMYQKLLTRLIRQWREDWQDLTLPFLFVQLPMHRYKQDPDWKNWPIIRQAQLHTYETVKNTGMAVALDCGEFNEIHPKDKREVAKRLALQALYHVYHKIEEEQAFGPHYKSYQIKDDKVELHFSYAKDGFHVTSEESMFEIAGDDLNFVTAEYEVVEDKIIVSAKEVKHPVAVRYCWTNHGAVPIFGKNGIPLAPFTTWNPYKDEIKNAKKEISFHRN